MSDSFGKKVRKLRQDQSLTLEDLAEKLETTKNYVWQLENKSPARPSGQLLLKIADIFEVSPDFLIDDSIKEESINQRHEALFRRIKNKNLSNEDIEKALKILDMLDD
ncbi:helix-turn-helix domain-containing protein [Kordiimonas pumila]|uniref:Helix-turn-helix domain-containing protein n=1 Tax=Kordiimonas pumila TaxID=2161677 RepID=A0ABV7D1J6_9PROT|nr:helix-turn-helix transcriptional regulator [Kordiimonas pumila]